MLRAVLAILFACHVAMRAFGQDAVRMSMAGEAAARARQTAEATPGYYNLELGPTYWRFGSAFSVGYNDNVELDQSRQEGDFLYSPSINAQMRWPVTQLQALNLGIGAGYSGYVQHSSLNTPYVTPNSGVSFDIYAGDFVIELHDRFSITQSSYQDPTVTGTGSYAQFQNTAGTLVTWDLNKLIVNMGYDHANNAEISGQLGQPGQSSEIFSASAGYALKPAMTLGIEAGGTLVNYSAATTNNPYSSAVQWNIGSFFRTPLTEYLSVSAGAGYVVNSPQSGALATATQYGGYYANLGITHRLNRFVQYTLSGGKGVSDNLFGGAVDEYTVGLSANWTVVRKLGIATTFNYERGTQIGTVAGETFYQYGPTIMLSRPITKKMGSSLQYQYMNRGATVEGQNYTLNVVTLSLSYQF